MSELHDRIRRSLAGQARSLRAEPDLGGLTDRIAHRHRRRMRRTSVALAVVLLAGPAAGFLAGRAGEEPERDRVMVADASGPLPTVALGGADTGAGSTAPERDGESSPGPPYPVGGPLARSFVREVGGGTTIRVYRAAVEPPVNAGPPWWEPPRWCFPNGYVQADVSTRDAVGIVTGGLYPEPRDGPVGGTLGTIGVAEGSPQWVVVAQAPAGAATVRATFPDGHVDEMEPVDGVAVLVGPATIDPGGSAWYGTTVPLEALDADGRSLGTGTARAAGHHAALLDLGAQGAAAETNDEPNAECFAPDALPPPGAEQPADPAAARAEIERLFGVRFADRTDDERLASLDDPTGMREVYEQMRTGPFAEEVLGSRPVFRDLVFLSATRAAVQYETEVPGYGPQAFGPQFGEVVLVDGEWKLTRESVCRDVQRAGVTCPPVR